ncbi:MAG: dNTP triphosphohydrolase [Opitutales bacterium]
MDNRFYCSFDESSLKEKRRDDYRSPFQVNRDRIIHSHAFRRLQSKTQVFLSGEYDFYRTRLTHSMEVAQVGRSICHYLRHREDPLSQEFFIDSDLVEAACLAHDLGHPPFGHIGERALHRLLKPHGGFEGNAQTLRILTEIIYQNESRCHGMNPTRAFLDGVLKYKALHGELEDPESHFLYDEQETYRSFVFDSRILPSEWNNDEKSVNGLRSIECQIMDWADDTAYSLNDIVDGVRAGFLTFQKIEKWAAGNHLHGGAAEGVDALLRAIREDRMEPVFATKIGDFIKACHLAPQQNFLSDLTNRYRYRLVVDPEIQAEAEAYKQMAFAIIFQSPQLQQIEYKGGLILSQLFRALCENYLEQPRFPIRFLPPAVSVLIEREEEPRAKVRRLADFLASMTDGMAIRMYKRLFNPDFASITEIT